MREIGILAVLIGSLFACTKGGQSENTVTIPLGHWRATISTQGKELPFELISRQGENGDTEFVIKNGSEKILLEKFDLIGDSLVLPMHIFDTKIVAKISGHKLAGYWTKNYEIDYKLPFAAEITDAPRFNKIENSINYDFSGKWETVFEAKDGVFSAIGEFQQSGNIVAGSFLKKAGDYRFLDGSLNTTGFTLSTFDGEHAYLFEGTLGGNDTIFGEFWSGKTGYYTWKAFRNENAQLSDPYNLTEIVDGYDLMELTFPNEYGETVSFSDEKFTNKVVIIQILGSWCPNCMDETAFLSQWYKENSDRGVEIIGLAFERKADLEYGASRIKILKDRYNTGYDILFAGKNDAETKQKALPMIKKLASFPTTIFVNRKGEIAKIHTGFSGPGTGVHYQEFIEEFNKSMDGLLK